MSDSFTRCAAFVDAEQATLIAAPRARALDRMGNRGSGYERSVRAWVRDVGVRNHRTDPRRGAAGAP
jgi:hypothetical protein